MEDHERLEQNLRRMLKRHVPVAPRTEFRRRLRLRLEQEWRRCGADGVWRIRRWKAMAASLLVLSLGGVILWISGVFHPDFRPPTSPSETVSTPSDSISENEIKLAEERINKIMERPAGPSRIGYPLAGGVAAMGAQREAKGSIGGEDGMHKGDAGGTPHHGKPWEHKAFSTPLEDLAEEGPAALSKLDEALRQQRVTPAEAEALRRRWREEERTIETAIDRMNDDSFDARKEARERLIKIGRPAVPYLVKASAGSNLRAAVEAETLLDGVFLANGYKDGLRIVYLSTGMPYALKKTGTFTLTAVDQLPGVFQEVPDPLKEIDFSKYMIVAYLEGAKQHRSPGFSHLFEYAGVRIDRKEIVWDIRTTSLNEVRAHAPPVSAQCDGTCVVHQNCVIILRKVSKPCRFDR